jgi:hypothetical protein
MVAFLYGLLFVAISIGMALASYFIARWITGGDPDKNDRELAGSILVRISALHALILALVLAQEMVDYQSLRSESAVEANAIADLYNDAARFDPVEGAGIREAARNYLNQVVDTEWASLARERRLAQSAWAHWEQAYAGVLDLKPGNERQASLRDHMLESVHTISEQRVKRESNGQDSLSALFWFAAVAGLIFSAIGYYPFRPEPRSLFLLSMYGAFTGIVLFLIYAFSNPYQPPGALKPGAFERLQDRIAADGTS